MKKGGKEKRNREIPINDPFTLQKQKHKMTNLTRSTYVLCIKCGAELVAMSVGIFLGQWHWSLLALAYSGTGLSGH